MCSSRLCERSKSKGFLESRATLVGRANYAAIANCHAAIVAAALKLLSNYHRKERLPMTTTYTVLRNSEKGGKHTETRTSGALFCPVNRSGGFFSILYVRHLTTDIIYYGAECCCSFSMKRVKQAAHIHTSVVRAQTYTCTEMIEKLATRETRIHL